ncbi:hypothetical protein DPEC_G00070610 [Dallia pectoralis]|uniref:Uncharacterized protein n=1 Tax=Dallia pectoralis TaxID=75939 RepID=A0ACC2H1W4_DALPE|nr:hypothetical protein DPEC_G00070610 [Dallia pectoralis]
MHSETVTLLIIAAPKAPLATTGLLLRFMSRCSSQFTTATCIHQSRNRLTYHHLNRRGSYLQRTGDTGLPAKAGRSRIPGGLGRIWTRGEIMGTSQGCVGSGNEGDVPKGPSAMSGTTAKRKATQSGV